MALNAYSSTFEYQYHVLGYASTGIHHELNNMHYICIYIYALGWSQGYTWKFFFHHIFNIIVANWLENEIGKVSS